MHAPGDSALIFALLAIFVACTGYAAGRLHQRWQAAQDREEAYRDGYENGTINVFSTAVRMLGPKRSARGAAPVTTTPTPEAKKHEKSDAPLGFPAPQPPPPYAVSEPPAIGGVIYRPLRDPRPADGSPPVMGEQPTRRPLPHPRTAKDSVPKFRAILDELGRGDRPELIKIREGVRDSDTHEAPAPQTPANLDELARPDRPKLNKIRDGVRDVGAHETRTPQTPADLDEAGHADRPKANKIGDGVRDADTCQAPTPQGPANLDELGHVGRPEVLKIREAEANLDELRRNGRPEAVKIREEGGDAPAATPASSEKPAAAKRRRGGHRAKPPEEDTTINQAAIEPTLPAGRHTVPDELVRATTYRLPPDRIFRAKVPENTPLPEEPTTRLPSVPKPRDRDES